MNRTPKLLVPLILVVTSQTPAASNTWTGGVNSDWDTATGNWTSPVTWANGDDAVFGAGVGTVNVTGDVTAASISAPGGGTSISIGSGKTLLVSPAAAAAPPWAKIAGSGTFALNSAQAVNGSANWGTPALPAGFTGTLRLDKGRVDGAPVVFGGASQVVVADGAQFLAFNGTAGTYTYAQNFSLAGMGWGEGGQNSGALRVSQMNATFSGNITLTGNAGMYTQSASGATLTVSGAIGESGGARALALNAYSNSITLNGAASNTHTGVTTVDGGTVYFGKTGGAYAVGGPVNLGAGNTNQPNLRMQQSDQFAPGVVLSFTNAASNWTRFDLLGTNQTLAGLSGSTGSGVVQNGGLGVGSATDATLMINGSGTTSYNGLIRNYDNVNSGGVLNLAKAGTGTQVMTGGNISYTGSTTISGGVLSTDVLAANGSNSGIGAGTALTLDGGTFRYTGGNNGSDGGAKFNRNITVGASGGTLDTTGGFAFFGGAISGTGPLTFLDSSGTVKQWLVTSSSGSFSGPVTIGSAAAGSGFVQLRSNAANLLGTGTVTLNAGGILSADPGSTTPATFANPLVLSGGRLGTQAPDMTFSGEVTLTASTTSLIGHYGNGSGKVNLSGVISGNGAWSTVLNDGANHVTFSGTGANTFTGGSTVNRGTVVLSKSADTAAVGNLLIAPGNANNNTLVYTTANNQFASGAGVTFNGTPGFYSRLELMGTTQTISGLSDATGYGIVQNSEFGPANTGASTLVLTGAGTTSFNGTLRNLNPGTNGTIGLTKNGAGTQTLSGGAITYSGATALNQGTLVLSTSGTFNSAITIASAAFLRLDNDVDKTLAGNLSGAGTITVFTSSGTPGATVRLSGSNSGFTGTFNLPTAVRGMMWSNANAGSAAAVWNLNANYQDKFAMIETGAGDSTVQLGALQGTTSGTVLGAFGGSGVKTFEIGALGTSTAFAGRIVDNPQSIGSSTAALTKTGGGSLTLTGNNTYSGTTTVSNGQLVAQGGSALGDQSTVNMADLATAALQITHSEQVGALNGGGALGGNISLANGIQLTLGNNDTSTSFGGVISGIGASLNKRGAGTQTLTGNNTFSGGVTIDGGGLSVDKIAVLGSQPLGTGTGAIAMLNGATLRFTGVSGATNRGLALSGTNGGQVDVGGGATLALAGSITGASANFAKNGGGTFNQAGSGDWTGNTFITGGTYNVASTGSIGNTGSIQLTGGATLNIDTATQVRAANLDIAAGTVNLNSGTLRTNGITMASGTGFTWGAATLTAQTTAAGSAGSTDRRAPGSSGRTLPVYEGTRITIDGAGAGLATSADSTLDLGPTYTSGAMRYDQLHVTGSLNLTAEDDVLNFAFNPYFFRPSVFGADAAGTLILVDATSFSGTFDSFTGVLNDFIGFTAAPGSGTVVGMLGISTLDPLTDIPVNTYYLEYESDSGNVLFHYRLSPSVPEPASGGLFAMGFLLLRMVRRYKTAIGRTGRLDAV